MVEGQIFRCVTLVLCKCTSSSSINGQLPDCSDVDRERPDHYLELGARKIPICAWDSYSRRKGVLARWYAFGPVQTDYVGR